MTPDADRTAEIQRQLRILEAARREVVRLVGPPVEHDDDPETRPQADCPENGAAPSAPPTVDRVHALAESLSKQFLWDGRHAKDVASGSERVAPHAGKTKEYWDVLQKPLRHVARRCGYALAVHGSLGFDIDLIAAPWRDSAISADALVEQIRLAAASIIGICEIRKRDERQPERKPCGRLAWSLYLVPDDPAFPGPYLDLSVFPPVAQPQAKEGA